MKKIILTSVIASVAGAAAWAQGLANTVTDAVPDASTPPVGGGFEPYIPLIIMTVLVAVAMSGNKDETPAAEEAPEEEKPEEDVQLNTQSQAG